MARFTLGTIALLIGTVGFVGCSSSDDNNGGATGGSDQGGADATGGSGDAGGADVGTGGVGNAGGAETGGANQGGEVPAGGVGNAGGSDVPTGGVGNAGGTDEPAGGAETGGENAGGVNAGGSGNAGGSDVPNGGAGTGGENAGGAVTAGGAGGAGGAAPTSGNTCETTDDCASGSVCFEGICIVDSNFRVTLSWEAFADLDLGAVEPGGGTIDWQGDGSYGYLDLDDCLYDSSLDLIDCTDPTGMHVENIVFDNPVAGDYSFTVGGFYTGAGDPSVNYTLTLVVDGSVVDTVTGSVATGDQDSYSLTYPLN